MEAGELDLLEIHTKHTLKKFQPGNKAKNKSKVVCKSSKKETSTKILHPAVHLMNYRLSVFQHFFFFFPKDGPAGCMCGRL